MHVLQMGKHDPSLRLSENRCVFTQHTPDGPVEVELTHSTNHDSPVIARCWGLGGEWILEHLPQILGFVDDPTQFQPTTARLRRLHQQHLGMRMTHLPLVAPQVVKVILMQLVSWRDAVGSWRRLLERWGAESPGPNNLRIPPSLADLRARQPFELIECGIIPKLIRTLKNVATVERHLEHAATLGPEEFKTRMLKTPGIGEWTTQYVLGTALGQSDALITGDYGLPNTVAWYFKRQDRADDARMIELLEPYAGHRFRVVRLLWIGGIQAPRRGPRAGSVRQRIFQRPR